MSDQHSHQYRTENASDNMLGRSRVEDTDELRDYYCELEQLSTTAFWTRANDIEPWEPVSRYTPTLWRYDDIRPMVIKSSELVSPEDAGRRVVVLLNNSEAGREHTAAVGWLFSGLQVMRPGEFTPAHKHTASAHRFIMEGGGAYTVVDGHEISLGANDYVLTPNGCWHDHGVHEDGKLSIWQDGLDIPLMNSLEANFYAVYPEPRQQRRYPVDDSPLSYGGVGTYPTSAKPWDKPYSPLMVYRWTDTRDALHKLGKVSDASLYEGHVVRYCNPQTGGFAMQTMGAQMQMLPAGMHTHAHRHTGNVMVNVAQGEGYSIVGGKRIDWSTHDIFCIPSWTWYEHVNTSGAEEEAFLFSYNDFPVMQALGVYLQESLADAGGKDHQTVEA